MSQRLYISFWAIRLENLPDGAFRRRTLSAAEAKQLIEDARRDGKVIPVSADDLLAPYKKREREKHQDLCKVLAKHYGIALGLKEFTGAFGEEDASLYFTNALDFARVREDSQMLVISCTYESPTLLSKGGGLTFAVAHDSVTFHLFEALPNPRIGSSLDSSLDEKGEREGMEARATSEVNAWK